MNGRGITGLIAGVLVLGIAVALGAMQIKQRIDDEILEIRNRKIETVNADSLRNVIEARILDSMRVELDKRDQVIDAIKKDLTLTRKQNAELEKHYRNIIIDMPNF
jgi:Na+-transporting NADH:ubiquinone oxidoreductase subunit NqrC